jgi:acyl carrier protein
MSEYSKNIRAFFSRFFKTDGLADADDIFAGGYVNSLFAMQLIAWLEKEFSITVEDDDLQLTNFNSVNAITSFIQKKNIHAVAAS